MSAKRRGDRASASDHADGEQGIRELSAWTTYEAIDTPAEFYWFTLEAKTDGMHWMTAAVIERFNMVTKPLLEPVEGSGGPFASEILELRQEIGNEDDQPASVH